MFSSGVSHWDLEGARRITAATHLGARKVHYDFGLPPTPKPRSKSTRRMAGVYTVKSKKGFLVREGCGLDTAQVAELPVGVVVAPRGAWRPFTAVDPSARQRRRQANSETAGTNHPRSSRFAESSTSRGLFELV